MWTNRVARYSGAHLRHAGLPFDWTADHDADVVILRRQGSETGSTKVGDPVG